MGLGTAFVLTPTLHQAHTASRFATMRPTLVLVLLLSVPLALALPCTQADNECLNNK